MVKILSVAVAPGRGNEKTLLGLLKIEFFGLKKIIFFQAGELRGEELQLPGTLTGSIVREGFSGCVRYERAYKTSGGYLSIATQVVDRERAEEIESWITNWGETDEEDRRDFGLALTSKRFKEVLGAVVETLDRNYELPLLERAMEESLQWISWLPFVWFLKRRREIRFGEVLYQEENRRAHVLVDKFLFP